MKIEVHWKWRKTKNITIMMDYQVERYIRYITSRGATHIETKIYFP